MTDVRVVKRVERLGVFAAVIGVVLCTGRGQPQIVVVQVGAEGNLLRPVALVEHWFVEVGVLRDLEKIRIKYYISETGNTDFRTSIPIPIPKFR